MSIRKFNSTLLIVISCCIWDTISHAQNGAVPIPDSIQKLPARVTVLETKVSSSKPVKDTTQALPCGNTIKCNVVNGELGVRWWLVFMPLILFLVVGGFFIAGILKGRFDLAETLSTGKFESTPPACDSATVNKTPATPVGSTSRLIAFVTGITAILIAICLLTYYAYFVLAECGGTPEFDGLWKILAGLGIGVIPYGVNVWRGNNKEKDNLDNQ